MNTFCILYYSPSPHFKIVIFINALFRYFFLWSTMNIMRKLRGNNAATSASGENARPLEDDSSQHTALGLMHLKKLFTDYIHSSHMLSDKERSTKLYTMIPLFCKVITYTSYQCILYYMRKRF